jgi:hypothetical protein
VLLIGFLEAFGETDLFVMKDATIGLPDSPMANSHQEPYSDGLFEGF